MAYTELTANDRVEWLTQRHDGIGASEIAAVMSRSPWSSPFDLHWRKRGPAPTEDVGGNEYTDWGHRIEPLIVDHFWKQHPEFALVTDVGVCVNSDRPWQRCTPDGLLCESRDVSHYVAGLETKNAHDRREWDDNEFQGLPQHYYDQVQHSMDVTGLPVWWVAVLFGGNTYAEYEVTYHEPYARELRAAGQTFWLDVLREVAPGLDAHMATTRRLIQLHPDLDDTEVEIAVDLAERYQQACRAYDEAKHDKDAATNEVRDAVGSGHYAVHGGRKVATRSVYDQTRIDADRLRAEHAEIADACSNTSTVHKITPTKPRKKAS